jgi:Flp pilus assembly protein CpaB
VAVSVVTSWLAWLRGPGRRRQWRRTVVRRCVAAGFAVVAVVGAVSVARAPAEPMVQVVVAARPLVVGEVVVPGAVRTVPWPVRLVPSGAAHRVVDVAGRPVAAPVSPGEALTETRFGGRSLLAGRPPDEVAMHVSVSDTGEVSMVSAGDEVDLVGADGVVARRLRVLRVDRPVHTDFGAVIGGEGSGSGYALDGPGLLVAAGQEAVQAIAAAPTDAGGRPLWRVVLRSR